jgi:hypothetical protein
LKPEEEHNNQVQLQSVIKQEIKRKEQTQSQLVR